MNGEWLPLLDEHKATLHAALEFYISRGMGDKAYRSERIEQLATADGKVIPLDEEQACQLLLMFEKKT